MDTWQPGVTAVLCGMFKQKPWVNQSVPWSKKYTANEVTLLLLPGVNFTALPSFPPGLSAGQEN